MMYAGNFFILRRKVFTIKSLLTETKIRSAYEIFYATCKQAFKVKNTKFWHQIFENFNYFVQAIIQ